MATMAVKKVKRGLVISAIAVITVLSSCTSEFCPAYAHGRQKVSHGKQQYAQRQRTAIPMPGSIGSMRP
jgi:hypothetical protein